MSVEKAERIQMTEITTDTIKELLDRRSVRAFEDRPVPEDIKRLLFRAAFAAPTAGNQQLYAIIDVTDQSLKEKLAVSCDNQPFIAKAPVVLVFCADCKRWHDAFAEAGARPRPPRAGDLLLAVDDALIAAQNLVTAAESLGLGSCYIGDIMENRETQIELLCLPKYVFPAAMLVLGYPTRQQAERPKPERLPVSALVHKNAYRELGPEELRQLYDGRCGERGFDGWMGAFCRRKYNSDFSLEMSRSVREWIEKDFSD